MNQLLRCYPNWVLLILVAMLVFGCMMSPDGPVPAQTPTAPLQGDVTARQLTVERHSAGNVVAVQIDNYLPVQANDQITVDQTGRALIRFSDQLLVELFRGSQIEIAQVRLEPAGSVFLRLRQALGHSQIELRSMAHMRLTLTTDYATITPITSDTKFAVCQGEGVTCTVTEVGETEVQAQGQPRRVRAGEGTFVLEGQPPLPPVCIDLNEIRQWMDRLRGPETVPALVTFVQDRPAPPCTSLPPPIPTLAPIATPASPVTGSALFSSTIHVGSGLTQTTYIHIPASEFTMGSNGGNPDEQPMHTVYLDEFWMMQTEVTNAQFAQCVAAGVCLAPRNERWDDPAFANHPVTGVNWSQANGYATWVGGRLPTEAEWEKAARGADGRIYPWGNQAPTAQTANFNTLAGDTVPVGQYPDGASPYDVLDLAGNVEEWVADLYDSDYYTYTPVRNPQGPATGTFGVLRGGSFYHDVLDLRASARAKAFIDGKFDSVGFRVATSAPLHENK
ncbi:MAG: formylglycine-generating enzyme family protein [Caldilineaceae bacterium]